MGWGWAIQEISRRQGDFALVGSVAMVHVDGADTCRAARLVLFGVGETPVRVHEAESRLIGQPLDDALLAEVAEIVAAALEPEGDIHASAIYRKEVGGVMARRTLQRARTRGGNAAGLIGCCIDDQYHENGLSMSSAKGEDLRCAKRCLSRF